MAWAITWAAGMHGLMAHATEPSSLPRHLPEIWQRVDEANAAVRSAQREWQGTQADAVSARLGPPTQFSVLSQAIDPRHLQGDAWHKPIDTIARIDHVIERGDKPALRAQVAEANQAAARQSWHGTVLSQRVAASQAYWDLKLAQEQLATRERHAQLAAETSRLAQIRLDKGDLSRLEATRLAVEAQRSQNDLGIARLAWRQAQQQLAALLRLTPQASQLSADDDWPTPPSTDGMAQDSWVAARPEVAAARSRWTASQQALSLADAQRSTDVTVSVQFEHNPVVADRLWGVGIAVPLGMDGRQDGPRQRALLAAQEAEAQWQDAVAQAQATWQAQGDALREASDRLQRLRIQLLPQAREALKAAEFARQQGALGLQDVLDARRALYAAELDEGTAQADLAKAAAALNTPAPIAE